MEKKTVYVETSIISYLTSRPSRDLVIAARQEITREIWSLLRVKFDLYISALVIQEASQGDNEVANKRLNTLSGIPILRITDKSQFIAQSLIDENAIPSAFEEDALHIAIASANGINLLLTWNFKHINNVFTKSKIIRCIENQGLIAPEICSPDEILGG
jgi:predicted nucleic acid-binding protein